MTRPTISLVIPCHNEEEGIAAIFKRLPAGIDEVIVVDNRSTDRTAEIAAAAGARVVSEERMGYGRAYRTGFAHATKDVIVTMDGDGTYPPEAIFSVVEQLSQAPYDFISCNRFPLADPRAMPPLNRFGNLVLTLLFWILTFRRIRDSQSGMWVFHRHLLAQFDLKGDGMPLSEEIKMEALLNRNVRFGEVHICYADRLGAIKLKRWSDGCSNLLFLFRKRIELWRRQRPKPILAAKESSVRANSRLAP